MRKLWVSVLLLLALSGCGPSVHTPYEMCGKLWKQGAGVQSGLDRHSWMMNCMDGYEKMSQQ